MKSLKSLWTNWAAWRSKSLRFFSLFLIAFYQRFLSGTLGMGASCRFYPSCSDYALLAFKKHSFLRATQLTAGRLAKCHPLGPAFVTDYEEIDK